MAYAVLLPERFRGCCPFGATYRGLNGGELSRAAVQQRPDYPAFAGNESDFDDSDQAFKALDVPFDDIEPLGREQVLRPGRRIREREHSLLNLLVRRGQATGMLA
jgi:hypothetical protein